MSMSATDNPAATPPANPEALSVSVRDAAPPPPSMLRNPLEGQGPTPASELPGGKDYKPEAASGEGASEAEKPVTHADLKAAVAQARREAITEFQLSNRKPVEEQVSEAHAQIDDRQQKLYAEYLAEEQRANPNGERSVLQARALARSMEGYKESIQQATRDVHAKENAFHEKNQMDAYAAANGIPADTASHFTSLSQLKLYHEARNQSQADAAAATGGREASTGTPPAAPIRTDYGTTQGGPNGRGSAEEARENRLYETMTTNKYHKGDVETMMLEEARQQRLANQGARRT